MLYFIDSANPQAVASIAKIYPVAGVTTNPTICSREKRTDFAAMMREIRQAAGPEALIFAQVISGETEGMVRDALSLRDFIGEPFCVKVPATPAGIEAVRRLKKLGVTVLVTAVFNAQQALLAARAGADWVAPYVNKTDDIIGDGAQVVAQIAQLYAQYGFDTRILAASFRNMDQVNRVALAGADAMTLPPAFYEKLLAHPLTDLALAGFDSDWKGVYGEKTLEELLKNE